MEASGIPVFEDNRIVGVYWFIPSMIDMTGLQYDGEPPVRFLGITSKHGEYLLMGAVVARSGYYMIYVEYININICIIMYIYICIYI